MTATDPTELIGGPEFLRLSEAAVILGISTRQAYRWAERGRLPTVDLGGARGRFVPARALYAFLASTAVVSLNGTASADDDARKKAGPAKSEQDADPAR